MQYRKGFRTPTKNLAIDAHVQTCKTALAFYEQGHLADAWNLYAQVLRNNPDQFDALHMSGLIALRSGNYTVAVSYFTKAKNLGGTDAGLYLNLGNGLKLLHRFDEALESYDKAIEIKADYAIAFNNRGNTLKDLKRFEDALLSYDNAIARKPDYANAFNNRGVTLQAMKRPVEALASYDKAIEVKADYAEAFFNRGVTLQGLNRLDDALTSYDKAIAIKPDYAIALNNRGNTLKDLKKFDEALASYEKAITIKADYAEAFYNSGVTQQEMKCFDAALKSYEKAIGNKADYANAFNNRGVSLQQLKRPVEALASYEKAIEIQADYAEAFYNRGVTLQKLNRTDEALASYDKAIELKADYAEAFNNRGVILQNLKHLDEALASYDRAIAIKADYADAHTNQSFLFLLNADFENGLAKSEWRKLKDEPHGDREFPKPLWLGTDDISGKTILVHWEQGLGDTIQFCRYIPLLTQMGIKTLFAPQERLQKLTSTLAAPFSLVDLGKMSFHFDYHCPLLSLPLAFKTNLDTIPDSVPYLAADPDLVRKWKAKIGEEGFKIGICWQGSTGVVDAGRSAPLSQFKALSEISDVRLISLHKGEGESQIPELAGSMVVETLGDDFDCGEDAFLDTAAVMKCCDLVITSDTAVAHLAGALGVKTWIALKHVPDWRWMLDRDDSPWYPTVRLFRQKYQGDWDEVFERITNALLDECKN